MATNLTFTKDGTKYVCELTPTEPVVVQVEREDKKDFTVYGYIDGMEPVALFSTSILKDLLFQLDVPEGVKVRMVSWSPVTSAKSA